MGIPTPLASPPIEKQKLAGKSNLVLAMCAFYIIQFFLPFYFLKVVLSIVSVIVFTISLPSAKPIPRYLSLVMFSFGILLYIMKGSPFEEIANGIITNLPLLTLVILVPLISIPLKIGGYFDSIHFYMDRLKEDPRKLFGGISFFLFCLGPILNLGSIRVLHELIKDLNLHAKLLAKSYLVGFSTVILWSPYFASVALVLYYLDVPVSTYISLGLPMAFAQLLIGNLLFGLWLKKKGYVSKDTILFHFKEKGEQSFKGGTHRNKIIILFVILVFLMGSIFVLELLTKWPMMFLVSLISLLFPLIWCSFKRKLKELREHFYQFKDQTAQTMNNEVVLFISAGLFGKALAGTAIADSIQLFLNGVSAASFMLFIVVVMFIIISLTFIGIHPIVVVTALITQMDAASLGTRPEVLALLMMVSWSISAVLSPANPLNILVSGSVNKSPLSVGLKWNGVYLISMFLTGSLYVYLLH
ncbi:hypothetical protein L1765_08955 [Microaerobacter geothermalis]|uniref:hypothetical protein n=1 Tax=Microaerobacter geothermalis TaxID=674972 RepID=UPI001F1C6C04|nr:hypothetical protein [Microaerobacter geothermalis]MCF6094089.1 hypothetical protein [Microaerobacter geothermalis]